MYCRRSSTTTLPELSCAEGQAAAADSPPHQGLLGTATVSTLGRDQEGPTQELQISLSGQSLISICTAVAVILLHSLSILCRGTSCCCRPTTTPRTTGTVTVPRLTPVSEDASQNPETSLRYVWESRQLGCHPVQLLYDVAPHQRHLHPLAQQGDNRRHGQDVQRDRHQLLDL